MIDEEAAGQALRATWPDAEIKELQPLPGGQWAAMAKVRVSGAPGGVPEELVLRVAPDPGMGAKEMAVQRAAHDDGVRTPMVHLTGGAGGPLGGAWAVMDLASGRPLLADLDGASAIRHLPGLLRRLPVQLAETMATIHRLDPAAIEASVRATAPGASLTVEDLHHHLHDVATGPVRTALERLWDVRPRQRRLVVCHGDLHPFNLLTDGDGNVTVLDWTGAAIAPPAYDVAFTWLLLRYPPLEAPALFRALISAGGMALGRRFLRQCRGLDGDLRTEDVRWFAGLHATRVLIELRAWQRSGDPRAKTHPWRLVAPGAATTLQRATGVDVTVSVERA